MSANAQQIPGLAISNGPSLYNINPATGEKVLIKNLNLGELVVPNTFVWDSERNFVAFITKGSNMFGGASLNLFSALNGNFIRSIQLMGSNSGGVLIPSINAYGFFSVTSTSNGYGNNEEDVSFKAIDIVTGRELYATDMNALSLKITGIPSYTEKVDNGIFNTANKNSGISNIEYIQELNQIAFCAMDVMGVNRFYRIDAATGRLISNKAVHHNILDFAYNAKTDAFEILAFNKTENGRRVYITSLDASTFRSIEQTILMEFGAANNAITGTLFENCFMEYDGNNLYAYIRDWNNNSTINHYNFVINADSRKVELSQNISPSNVTNFKFQYNPNLANQISYLNSVSVYPNPASAKVTVASTSLPVESIEIYTTQGALVQRYAAEGAMFETNINTSDLQAGSYMVIINHHNNRICKPLVVQH